MKRFLITILIIILLGGGACAVLQLTGIYDFGVLFSSDEAGGKASFYVCFMDDYFVMDEDGIVINCTQTEPSDIPEIEDMMFESFTVGKDADAESTGLLEYVKEVCSLLDVYDVPVSYISASGGEITLYLTETLIVELGENDDTDIKIKDLKNLYSKLADYEGGILYMTSADTNGQGYTFKEISSEPEEEESAEAEESSEEESVSDASLTETDQEDDVSE